ncbi:GAF domain-containing protein, partial [Cellulomonas septica]|uniref:GAF domain-containing protein n=1 Tax=Cellulomonas septica TaxID=285080 RepID=UPI001FEB6A2B
MGVETTEDARLAALAQLDMLDTPPEERFDRVVRLAQQLFGVPTVFVSLVDRDRLFYKAKVGLEQDEAARDTSFCRFTIEQPGTFVVEDATADPRFVENPWVVDDPHLRFYAGHPLVAPGGHRVGTFCLMDVQPREFGAQDAVLLRDLASWVEQELVVDDELQRAAQVQAGLLPRTVPDVPGYGIAGACLPARAGSAATSSTGRSPTDASRSRSRTSWARAGERRPARACRRPPAPGAAAADPRRPHAWPRRRRSARARPRRGRGSTRGRGPPRCSRPPAGAHRDHVRHAGPPQQCGARPVQEQQREQAG